MQDEHLEAVVKRSEYLTLMDFVFDLRDRDSNSYNDDDYSAGLDSGREQAYETAGDDLEYKLREMVVDVEDVLQCDGVVARGLHRSPVKRPHELGSQAEYLISGRTYGCSACLSYTEDQAKL